MLDLFNFGARPDSGGTWRSAGGACTTPSNRANAVPCGRHACNSLVAAVLLLCITGCTDRRISIHEFIQIQEQSAPVIAPEPEVNPRPAELWAERSNRPYRVGPSDTLTVTLTGLDLEAPTLPTITVARVDREGHINLPLVGPVTVADMELEDVEQAILGAYVPAYFQSGITVHTIVSDHATTDVVVVGAVATPGIIRLKRTERDVLHAVASAGGLAYVASGKVTIKRIGDAGDALTLNLLDPVELEKAFEVPDLNTGDIIEVEAATPNTIFVAGLVNVPGPQAFPPGTEVSLLQLLAAAGGVREDVLPTEATLVRRLEDGTDVQVRIDLEKLRSGEDPNIMLAAGDIFWVPETFGTRFVDFVNRSVFFRAGVSTTYNVTGNATGIEFLNRRDLQRSSFANVGRGSTLQDRIDPAGFLFR